MPSARPHRSLTRLGPSSPPSRLVRRGPRSFLVGSNRSRDRVLDVTVLDVTVLDVTQWRIIQLGVRHALEGELLILLGTLCADPDDLAGLDLAVEESLGQGVLDVALD